MAAKRRHQAAGTAVLGAALVGCALGQAGCALLIPPSWRANAPVPLAGELPPAESSPAISAEELASLSDEQLRTRIESQRLRLIELAESPEVGPLATAESEQEMREIAQRLPVLQHEVEKRGLQLPGTRLRHPTIR